MAFLDATDLRLAFVMILFDLCISGTYFIDHVNRRTQYENPVLVAKAVNQSAGTCLSVISQSILRSQGSGKEGKGFS